MKTFTYSAILLCLLLNSCGKQISTLPPEFAQAEALMSKHADSALLVLQAMQVPPKSNERQLATYCLLYTQAFDKNYFKTFEKHSSDSLITIAVNYFDKYGDNEKKATAWYYAARVNHDLNKKIAATEYYVKARDYANQTNNYNLRALICTNLGNLYFFSASYQKSLDMKKESLAYNKLANDTAGCIFSLRDIARSMHAANKLDSSLIYSHQALKMAEEAKNTVILPSVLMGMASFYSAKKEHAPAINAIKRAISLSGNFPSSKAQHLILGQTFAGIKETDSARLHLTAALESPDIYTRTSAYRYLYFNEQQVGNLKKAIDYNEMYLKLRDSIANQGQRSRTAEIQEKYDNELLINANNRLKLKTARQTAVIALIITASLVLFIILYVFYRRNIKKRELKILESQIVIQNHKSKILENERIMMHNLEMISEKDMQLSESQQRIEENEELMQQNKTLHTELKSKEQTYRIKMENSRNSYLKEREELLNKMAHLLARQQQLIDRIIKEHVVLGNLLLCVKKYKSFPPEDLNKVIDTIDELYENFTKRLTGNFPGLSKVEVLTCCLIKLRLKPLEIATVTNTQQDAIYKRNQRIRERMKLDRPKSLDEFLMTF